MKRLFLGLGIPSTIQEQIVPIQQDLDGAKWSAAANLHLTLHFIGLVDEQSIPALCGALQQVTMPSIELTLQAPHFWPRNILWLDVIAPEELFTLSKQLDQLITELGYDSQRKPFHPHVTIAKLDKGMAKSPLLADYLSYHEAFSTDSFVIDEYTLFESTLDTNGNVVYLPLRP